MQGATKAAAAAAGSNLQAAAKKVQQKAAAAAAAATAAIAAAEPAPSPPAAAGPKGTLIVCPLSVLSNWQTQIEEHTAGNLQVRIVCVLLLSYLTCIIHSRSLQGWWLLCDCVEQLADTDRVCVWSPWLPSVSVCLAFVLHFLPPKNHTCKLAINKIVFPVSVLSIWQTHIEEHTAGSLKV